jgi:hypothetical protein
MRGLSREGNATAMISFGVGADVVGAGVVAPGVVEQATSPMINNPIRATNFLVFISLSP